MLLFSLKEHIFEKNEMKWNREDLKAWSKIPTRWMDDDIYGHVNNVVYYSYFDTAVNGNLIRATGQDTVSYTHLTLPTKA